MNKIDERNAFTLAYGLINSWNIVEGEAPDFLCERSGRIILGTEITQLWSSETDARLANIEGYVLKLLEGGKFVHKNDHSNLIVDKVKLIPSSDDAPLEEVDALIQSYPTSMEGVAMLSDVIAKKNSKVQDYLSRCPIVDLVVDDASMIFSFKEFEEVLLAISLSSSRLDIIRSPFREVFLLTKNEKSKKISIPLKVNLLLEDILILENIISKEKERISVQQNTDDLKINFCSIGEFGLF